MQYRSLKKKEKKNSLLIISQIFQARLCALLPMIEQISEMDL